MITANIQISGILGIYFLPRECYKSCHTELNLSLPHPSQLYSYASVVKIFIATPATVMGSYQVIIMITMWSCQQLKTIIECLIKE